MNPTVTFLMTRSPEESGGPLLSERSVEHFKDFQLSEPTAEDYAATAERFAPSIPTSQRLGLTMLHVAYNLMGQDGKIPRTEMPSFVACCKQAQRLAQEGHTSPAGEAVHSIYIDQAPLSARDQMTELAKCYLGPDLSGSRNSMPRS